VSEVQYGNKIIEYRFKPKDGLKSHYITVEKKEGVVLKGAQITDAQAQAMILKKARWILDKLEVVKAIEEGDIVTGARVQYLGRRYYVHVYLNDELDKIEIDFTESKFKVSTPTILNKQESLQSAFDDFFTEKAIEKIPPRVKKWSDKTGLEYTGLKFMKLDKRWGSCTPTNRITLNIDAVKLSYSLLDYLIVHELVHTKVKNHSKEFWAEVSKHVDNWRELDERMEGMKM
jgi:predicted metal-dependent hydrolase